MNPDIPYLNLYLVRHGESRAQTGEELSMDSGLSDKGILQAQHLGEALSGITFDQAWISPLRRAQETFQAMKLHCGTVITDPRLTENMPYGQPAAERASALWSDFRRMADALHYPVCRNLLIVSHAMFLNDLLREPGNGYEFRLDNAHAALVRVPVNHPELRPVLAGLNLDWADAAHIEPTVKS